MRLQAIGYINFVGGIPFVAYIWLKTYILMREEHTSVFAETPD